MRKIEAQMINAVRDCLNGSEKTWRSGNTEVTTCSYERFVEVRLHGNLIAEFDSYFCGDPTVRGLTVSDCGWRTNTTKSRINSLLKAFTSTWLDGRLCQRKAVFRLLRRDSTGRWWEEDWDGSYRFRFDVLEDNDTLRCAEAMGMSK